MTGTLATSAASSMAASTLTSVFVMAFISPSILGVGVNRPMLPPPVGAGAPIGGMAGGGSPFGEITAGGKPIKDGSVES